MCQKKYICIALPNGEPFSELCAQREYLFGDGKVENIYNQVKLQLEEKGIFLMGKESFSKTNSSIISHVFHFGHMDYGLLAICREAIQVYMAFEPPCVDSSHSEKRLKKLSKCVDYVCTWNDNLIGRNAFVKFNYMVDFSIRKQHIEFEDRSLITNLSANKAVNYPNELYSERYHAIQYLDQHEPSFEFYGDGWESEKFPSYKGNARSKIQTLSQYKFSLCFENQKNLNGYITEKLLECILCGAVPVYWGADNILDYVPENCFIDFRNFNSIEDLHDTLSCMTKETWEKYIENIESFINSSKEGPFSPTAFSQMIEGFIYRKKRIRINTLRISCLRLLKTLSRIESVYRRYGTIGIYKKYIEILKTPKRQNR